MLLSAVSVLVVAQSSSEIPEGLMNNPVFTGYDMREFYSFFLLGIAWLAEGRLYLTFRGPCIVNIFLFIYFQQDATLQSLFISGKLLCIFRVVSPPIIRSTHNCIYSIWYLSNRYCYLLLLWKCWNWFECGVEIVLICFGAIADLRQHSFLNLSVPLRYSTLGKYFISSAWTFLRLLYVGMQVPLQYKSNRTTKVL